VTPERFLACVKVLTLIRKVFSYNSKIRDIFETIGVMSRVEEMASERATILLNRAIEAFLLESSIEQRLGQVSACIDKLEDYKPEVPDELNELKQIRNVLASVQQHLAPERELEITDRLLELYVTVSDGALIF
jgi:uncharacterized protein YutE (UPF0331/DUF86 family)